MAFDRRRPALAAGLLAASTLLFAFSCGDGEGRHSLKEVMIEMDWSTKRLTSELGDPVQAAEDLVKIRDWMQGEAWGSYASKRWNAKRSAAFEAQRVSFQGIVEGVLAVAESGDVDALPMAYGRMRFSCEVCHGIYRPQLK